MCLRKDCRRNTRRLLAVEPFRGGYVKLPRFLNVSELTSESRVATAIITHHRRERWLFYLGEGARQRAERSQGELFVSLAHFHPSTVEKHRERQDSPCINFPTFVRTEEAQALGYQAADLLPGANPWGRYAWVPCYPPEELQAELTREEFVRQTLPQVQVQGQGGQAPPTSSYSSAAAPTSASATISISASSASASASAPSVSVPPPTLSMYASQSEIAAAHAEHALLLESTSASTSTASTASAAALCAAFTVSAPSSSSSAPPNPSIPPRGRKAARRESDNGGSSSSSGGGIGGGGGSSSGGRAGSGGSGSGRGGRGGFDEAAFTPREREMHTLVGTKSAAQCALMLAKAGASVEGLKAQLTLKDAKPY
ncbi:hypothetical protein B484DRAFT_1265 [Ochromonadaceae sp. CCMP2298]|nr:hypothetical protein B484DRAFT_1265 [Ochromonadaceae sp. CCMP2298]